MKLYKFSIALSAGILLLVTSTGFAEVCSLGSPCSFNRALTDCSPATADSTNGGGICPYTQRIIQVTAAGNAPLLNNTTYEWKISQYSCDSIGTNPQPTSCPTYPGISGDNNMVNITSVEYINAFRIRFTTGPKSGGTPSMAFTVMNPNHNVQVLFNLTGNNLVGK